MHIKRGLNTHAPTNTHKHTHTHTPHTHTHSNTLTRTLSHTHTRTRTHARTQTHMLFLWTVGTLHRCNGLYTVQSVCAYCPTPKLSPHRRTVHLYPQKTHSVWFRSVLNYWDTENVLINHLLLVIPVIPMSLYKFCVLINHINHTHTHTHTHAHPQHTRTHTHKQQQTHTHTQTNTTHTHTHARTHHKQTRTHTHTHTHTLIHTETRTNARTHTHTYTHTHTPHTHTHTHNTHTHHTHTHSLSCSGKQTARSSSMVLSVESCASDGWRWAGGLSLCWAPPHKPPPSRSCQIPSKIYPSPTNKHTRTF